MATVHSYLRFSDEKQADGRSADRQQALAVEFCKTGGHTLSNLKFDDKGKSGYRGDKQRALKKFLSEIGKKVQPGDILFVEAIDRLGRKGVRATQDLVNKILNAGIDIAIAYPIKKTYRAEETNNVGDAIELAAFAFQAHIYSQQLSKRISDHWEASRKKAKETKIQISGILPCWLKTKDEPIPEAVEVVRYMFQRTIEGIGAKQLCRELNNKFPPIGGRKNSKGYNATFVRDVIRGRAVLGEYTPHTYDENRKRIPLETIKGYYPAIITEETWLAANSSADNRTKERGPSGDFVNVFVGLVHHALDKCPCHISTYQQRRADGRKVIFRRLKSWNAIQNLDGACTATVEVADFENAILRHLIEIDPAIFQDQTAPTIELQANKERLTQVEKRIVVIQQSLKTIDLKEVQALVLGPLAELQHEQAELKDVVRQQAGKLTANPKQQLARLKELHSTPNTPENRQKLREALKQVITDIWIAPVKLGDKRRDTVAALIEVNFVGGHRKKILLCKKRSITYTDYEPTEGSLADIDPITWQDEFKEQMLDLQTKGFF